MTFSVVMRIFGKFAYLFVVSLLMGVVFGLVVALLLKKYNVSTYPQVNLPCSPTPSRASDNTFSSVNLVATAQSARSVLLGNMTWLG